MKVAILYVGVGKYSVFWEDFYKSAEEFLLKDIKKTYFVFTDDENLYGQDNDRIIKIHQEKLGWPYDTLMRFEMFLSQEEKLKEFDYIYFFNANMKFVNHVGNEILPDEAHDGLVAGLHPGPAKHNSPPDTFPYCRNEKSLAYIPYGQGKYYVQGCLNGGTRDAYLKLCHVCNDNTKKDLENNVIANVHDESHLNKYVLDKNLLVLPCNYLYPNGSYLKQYCDDIKCVQRDKYAPKYGGIKYLRGTSDKKITFDFRYEMTKLGYALAIFFTVGNVKKKFKIKALKFKPQYE